MARLDLLGPLRASSLFHEPADVERDTWGLHRRPRSGRTSPVVIPRAPDGRRPTPPPPGGFGDMDASADRATTTRCVRTPTIRRWEMAGKTGRRVAAATNSKRSTEAPSTAAETVEAIRAWTVEHGHVPTEQDWEHASADHPSAGVVMRRFGSWKGGLAAAGYVLEPGHRPGAQP